jgi:hypothetical protein
MLSLKFYSLSGGKSVSTRCARMTSALWPRSFLNVKRLFLNKILKEKKNVLFNRAFLNKTKKIVYFLKPIILMVV